MKSGQILTDKEFAELLHQEAISIDFTDEEIYSSYSNLFLDGRKISLYCIELYSYSASEAFLQGCKLYTSLKEVMYVLKNIGDNYTIANTRTLVKIADNQWEVQ